MNFFVALEHTFTACVCELTVQIRIDSAHSISMTHMCLCIETPMGMRGVSANVHSFFHWTPHGHKYMCVTLPATPKYGAGMAHACDATTKHLPAADPFQLLQKCDLRNTCFTKGIIKSRMHTRDNSMVL